MSRNNVWHFVRPKEAGKVIRFENDGETFSAMYKARGCLHDNGYCYGSSCCPSPYIPAMKGPKYTLPQKIYNFNLDHYMQVTAVMYSLDYRDGWVEVWFIEPMYILDLVLTYKWYDMIQSGEKTEEYRAEKWRKRLLRKSYGHVIIHRSNNTPTLFTPYTHVRFHRGYTSTTMIFHIDGIAFGIGNPDWGAPKDEKVFIIKLGKKY